MQTSNQRGIRPRKPAAAPYSQAAARLIEQVQAEAREQLLKELSAKDTIIVLQGFDVETKHVMAGSNAITIRDSKGNHLRLYRHHVEPDTWRGEIYMQGHWHPARWYGHQTLVDASGTAWDREISVHVCDDFGNLVPVAA